MDELIRVLEEIRPDLDFAQEKSLIDGGVLDSFDIITLISMLEEKYDTKIDGLDIVPENFASVDSIETLVLKSKGEA